jgi:5-methylcytosine-specific restriction endonuclease McrA
MANPQVRERRRKRKKQLRINQSLKRKLCNNITSAPCCYCKEIFTIDKLTIEHLVPHILGGTNEKSNIDLACTTCNQQRGREAWFLRKSQKLR